jgi:hypothetical protein
MSRTGRAFGIPRAKNFPDDASAMREASKVAQELSKLRLHPYDWRVVVKNAEGIRVGSVPLTPREDAAGDPVPPPPVH